jgi:hypothetical protein
MQIVGEWLLGKDGITRPVVEAAVGGVAGKPCAEHFLIDTGADRTVFSAALLAKLRLPVNQPPLGSALTGISGDSTFVLVTTVVEFVRDDGGPARVRGEFAAFVDPAATDLSILGRDVLNNFDVILSRRRNEILLLAPNHHYHVARA